MHILTYLNDIDTNLFLFLNGIHSPAFDTIFAWITNKKSWIPLYLLLFFITALKFKWKTVFIALAIGLLVLMADKISVLLFKEVFERLRPCHNPDITNIVHIIDGHCGGKYGFVSSHAANSFAVAVFSGFLLKNHYKFILPILLFWATLVSYSRVYVGVHYPGDILFGGILGCIIGVLVLWLTKLANRQFNLKMNFL
jgi:undecaprenyl-diphosphatase